MYYTTGDKLIRNFMRESGVSMAALDKYISRMNNSYVEPTVIETNPTQNMLSIGVFSRLMMDRILWLGTEINSDIANIVTAQLLFLSKDGGNLPINMYINSPGGSVYDGMAIYDTMKWIDCPVTTTCVGMAASMGAVLLAGGEHGKRYSLPHSQIMIHEPMGGVAPGTKCTDYMIEAEQMKKCKDMLMECLAGDCGKTIDEMTELCAHDKWYTPKEAIIDGIIDSVVEKKK